MIEAVIDQAPQIVPVITDDRDFYVNLVLAIITLLAVLISFFQEQIRRFFSQAKVNIDIVKEPPDSHQILITNQSTGLPISTVLYSRIRVTNYSKMYTAKNVEVFLSRVWKVARDGAKSDVKTFLPMNLKWSHLGGITASISPLVYKYCDLGYFYYNKVVHLHLDTVVNPNPVAKGVIPNILEPGEYEFELLLSGENIIPITSRWKLKFNKTWYSGETTMLDRITIMRLEPKK